MSEPRYIEIISGNTSNGKITLDPEGTVDVEDGDTVIWTIAPKCSEVASFRIKKKIYSKQIFKSTNAPSSDYGKRTEGLVDHRHNRVTYYTYSIKWKDQSGDKYTHDPIIAVKPSPFIGDSDSDSVTNLIIGAVVAVAAFLSIRFLLNKRKENAWRNDGFKNDL